MKERNRLEIENERKRKLEIIETKKNLWKWRGKGKKLEKENEKLETLKKVQNMEERIRIINNMLEDIEKEKERKRLKDLEDKNKKTAEWRKKVRLKDRKEAERKEQLEIDNRIANNWAMINWVTDFIKENEEEWDLVRESKLEEANRELENWKKLRRLEKIKHLQRKWNSEPREKENYEKEKVLENWTVWRKKPDIIENNSDKVVTTQTKNHPDTEINTQNVPITQILPVLKKPRIIIPRSPQSSTIIVMKLSQPNPKTTRKPPRYRIKHPECSYYSYFASVAET